MRVSCPGILVVRGCAYIWNDIFLLLYLIGQNFVGQNFTPDKISSPSQNFVTFVRKHAKFYCFRKLSGENYSSDKTFVIQTKFRQFFPTKFCRIRYFQGHNTLNFFHELICISTALLSMDRAHVRQYNLTLNYSTTLQKGVNTLQSTLHLSYSFGNFNLIIGIYRHVYRTYSTCNFFYNYFYD